jgi:hypothetical protein
MKNLPYSSCFVVVQINNKIEKMYFDEIVKYADHTDYYLNAFKEYFVSIALSKDNDSEKEVKELYMFVAQAYLNSKIVIKEFKSISKTNCKNLSDLCVTLIVDIHEKKDGGASIQFVTLANDEKRDAFNYIAQFVSDSKMQKYLDALTIEQQDLLFDFV